MQARDARLDTLLSKTEACLASLAERLGTKLAEDTANNAEASSATDAGPTAA